MSNYIKCKWIKHTNQGQILAEWIKNKIKVYAFYNRHTLDLMTRLKEWVEGLIKYYICNTNITNIRYNIFKTKMITGDKEGYFIILKGQPIRQL